MKLITNQNMPSEEEMNPTFSANEIHGVKGFIRNKLFRVFRPIMLRQAIVNRKIVNVLEELDLAVYQENNDMNKKVEKAFNSYEVIIDDMETRMVTMEKKIHELEKLLEDKSHDSQI